MIQNKEITHSEFEKSCKLFGYETFSDKQMEAYIQDAKSLLEKSEKEELNDIEKSQLDEFNVNCASLKQINVVNDDLTKSLIYFRPAQVIWDKDENGEIMKSRAGTYADTPQNKKLGRVGQKYGGSKGEEKKEAKPFNIPSIKESLAKDYHDGKMTISQVAEELHEAGHTNFVDIGYANKVVEKFKKEGGEGKKEGGESKPLIAHSSQDIKWEEDPNGGQFAKYKMGTISKYTEDGKTSFSVKTNKGSFNASSMEDAISKIDKESK